MTNLSRLLTLYGKHRITFTLFIKETRCNSGLNKHSNSLSFCSDFPVSSDLAGKLGFGLLLIGLSLRELSSILSPVGLSLSSELQASTQWFDSNNSLLQSKGSKAVRR